jgi:hypothetical protein
VGVHEDSGLDVIQTVRAELVEAPLFFSPMKKDGPSTSSGRTEVVETHVSHGLGTSVVTGAVPPPLRPRGRLPSGLGDDAPDAARNLPERGGQPVAAALAG